MRNFDLIVTTKSGVSAPIVFDNCSDAIAWLAGYGDDQAARQLRIEVIADDGRKILITIPNDASTKVAVEIQEADPSGSEPTPPS